MKNKSVVFEDEDGGYGLGIVWAYKRGDGVGGGEFEVVIKKPIIACENSLTESKNHFTDASKMVNLGSGSKRKNLGLWMKV